MHVVEPWTGTHSLLAIEEMAAMFRDNPRLMKITLLPEWADPEMHNEHTQKQASVIVPGLPWLMYAYRPLAERDPPSKALDTRTHAAVVPLRRQANDH